MPHDFAAPAELTWHPDEEDGPDDWSGAVLFPTLRAALEAVVNGTPQTGHPWIRSSSTIYPPHAVEDLWREDRMR